MTNSPAAQRRGTLAVSLVAVAWVLAVLVAIARWLGVAMQNWGDAQSNGGLPPAQLETRGIAATEVLAAVVVGGPVLIAVVAFFVRLAWTGAFFLVMAAALGALALLMTGGGYLPAQPVPTPQPTHSICQESSGGDTHCPGG